VSVLTTLERRFNLQSADVGVIASSFEIGNLALILFVSYFGARGHRPRLIGCGGIVMALGALLSALPEFLTHQYKYEAGEIRWGAEGRDVCATNGSSSDEGPDPDLICRNRTATNMMYLLLIGAQVLLGIGATPVQPLGVSYIDDHVRRKDSSLYIATIECPLRYRWDFRTTPPPPTSSSMLVCLVCACCHNHCNVHRLQSILEKSCLERDLSKAFVEPDRAVGAFRVVLRTVLAVCSEPCDIEPDCRPCL
ncbi:hypothetical protein STEG23_036530, partial [Scotinomys teguina]